MLVSWLSANWGRRTTHTFRSGTESPAIPHSSLFLQLCRSRCWQYFRSQEAKPRSLRAEYRSRPEGGEAEAGAADAGTRIAQTAFRYTPIWKVLKGVHFIILSVIQNKPNTYNNTYVRHTVYDPYLFPWPCDLSPCAAFIPTFALTATLTCCVIRCPWSVC